MPDPDLLIEVVVLETGDWALAEDEAGALLAARTMCNDASVSYGVRPTVLFNVDGVTVRIVKGAEL